MNTVCGDISTISTICVYFTPECHEATIRTIVALYVSNKKYKTRNLYIK